MEAWAVVQSHDTDARSQTGMPTLNINTVSQLFIVITIYNTGGGISGQIWSSRLQFHHLKDHLIKIHTIISK